MAVKKDYLRQKANDGMVRTTLVLDEKVVNALKKVGLNISAICRDALANELKRLGVKK